MPVMASTALKQASTGPSPHAARVFVSPSFSRVTVAVEVILLPENIEEGTSIGGALIAGVGIGLFEDYSCAKKFLKIKQNISPNPEYEELYKKKQDIFEQSYYALKEINKELYQM